MRRQVLSKTVLVTGGSGYLVNTIEPFTQILSATFELALVSSLNCSGGLRSPYAGAFTHVWLHVQGQFLVEDLGVAGYAVAFTHLSSAVPALAGIARAFPVDLATGAGLDECLASLGPVAAVINCAAVSSPAVCERDPIAARCALFSEFLQAYLRRCPSCVPTSRLTHPICTATAGWHGMHLVLLQAWRFLLKLTDFVLWFCF